MRKGEGLAKEALAPTLYGSADAEHVLVCWGSTYGPCREAVELLTAGRASVAMLHFSQVWPLNVAAAKAMLTKARRVTVIEGNSSGQFAGLLRQVGVLAACEQFLKYNGLPFTGEEIAGRFAK
jgi:2-oxoglutarate ferredoxin oxidoreductase subunit alpha